jgi:hypothetical protein
VNGQVRIIVNKNQTICTHCTIVHTHCTIRLARDVVTLDSLERAEGVGDVRQDMARTVVGGIDRPSFEVDFDLHLSVHERRGLLLVIFNIVFDFEIVGVISCGLFVNGGDLEWPNHACVVWLAPPLGVKERLIQRHEQTFIVACYSGHSARRGQAVSITHVELHRHL